MKIVKRWPNHKLMIRWLSHLFGYLERFFIPWTLLPSLNQTRLISFHDLIYEEVKGRVTDVVITLINKEREEHKIDRALLKNVADIFVGVGIDSMACYETDFEPPILQDAAA